MRKIIQMLKDRFLKVYAVTDSQWLGERTLPEAVEEAIKGGATLIQLREKKLSGEALIELGREVKAVCAKYGVPLIINDRPEIALACGADGVHVGQSDMPVEEARRILGDDKIIGVSAQTVKQALAAQNGGADYLGVGAVIPTATKPDAVDVTRETLMEICRTVDIPVVAIGGINETNISDFKDTGIAGVAVVSAIFAKDDVQAAAAEIAEQCEKCFGAIDENCTLPIGNAKELDSKTQNLKLADADASNKQCAECGSDDGAESKYNEDLAEKCGDSGKYELKYKAAVFDCDGTILDSMPMWRTAGSSYLRSKGKNPDIDVDDRLRVLTLEESAEWFREDYGVEGSNEEIVDGIMSLVKEKYMYTLQPKEGIEEMLEDLLAHGVRMCIATVTPADMIEAAIKRLGFDRYFEHVYSCSDRGINKNIPDIYYLAQEHLGAEVSETLVYEDVVHAVRTAYKAGFPVVGIYDDTSFLDKDEIKEKSVLYMDSYTEWPGIENL